jgi:hypothetical protein
VSGVEGSAEDDVNSLEIDDGATVAERHRLVIESMVALGLISCTLALGVNVGG